MIKNLFISTIGKWALAAWLTLSLGGMVFGEDAKGVEFFEKKIRPLFLEHCSKCHSSQDNKVKGGLSLDTRESTLKGGDTKAAIVPGKPEESLLIQTLGYNGDIKMPPKGKLSDQAIADLTQWVKMGAPDPRTGNSANTAKKNSPGTQSDWWSFQPVKAPRIPTPGNAAYSENPVDRFLLKKMEDAGITPAKEASRANLIRRLYYDLVGLPPSPEKILAFENNTSPGAYENLVDELLKSPQFGERWARHWLDIVRFAQSSGGGRTTVFPDAWRYRDYVISSFQEDKAYNRFLMEQIAGDLVEARSNREREANLVATGFLALGPTNFERQDKKILEMDVVDEQLDTIGKAFMGMTLGCVRCHDHKFDPIPISDYYALAGIFKSTRTLIHDNVSRWVDRPLPMEPEAEKALKESTEAIAKLEEQIKGQKKKKPGNAKKAVAVADLDGIVVDDIQAKKVGNWMSSTSRGTFIGEGYIHDENKDKGEKTVTFTPDIKVTGKYEVLLAYSEGNTRSPSVPVTIFHADGEKIVQVNMKKAPDIDDRFVSLGQYRFENSGQGFVIVSNMDTKGHVTVDAVQFLRVDDAPKVARSNPAATESPDLKKLEDKLKELKAKAPPKVVAMAVEDEKKTADIRVCIRGNIHTPGELVKRGFLQAVKIKNPPQIPADQSGRMEFALWLGNTEHSLTYRVYVNRVWSWIFGSGIVRTVDNFGTTGETPSHPELLDYLVGEFTRNGFSTKKLIRLLVTSKAYRQASENPAANGDIDNRLFARMNRKRLEVEAIRDSILTVSSHLDGAMNGPNMPAGLSTEYGYKFTDRRRSIYTPVFRNTLPEIFEVFDFPDPNLIVGKRNVSTVAPQALYLMNNPFILSESQAAAEELLKLTDLSNDQRTERMYLLVIGRKPTESEVSRVNAFLNRPDAKSPQDSWSLLFQAMFSTLDFRYYQ